MIRMAFRCNVHKRSCIKPLCVAENFVYLEVIYLTETLRRRGESVRILYTETCVANAPVSARRRSKGLNLASANIRAVANGLTRVGQR